MTTQEKVARRKRSLLELATALGNVSKACRLPSKLSSQRCKPCVNPASTHWPVLADWRIASQTFWV